MTYSRSKSLFAAVLLALLLSSCASEQKLQGLDDTLKIYQSSFRWSKFDDLERFQRDVPRPDSEQYQRMKSIRITSYQEKHRIVTDDYMQAEQLVQIGFYDENTGIEKQILDKQVWKYDAEKDIWYLSTPLPAFNGK